MLDRAAAALAEHAEAVGLVVEQERVGVLVAQLDELGQRRGVAAHRVDAVDDDALAGVGRELVEDLAEPVDVVVAEALHRRARELRAGEQRVVGVFVEDDVVVAVQEAADRADVRHVAGGEDERRLPAVELGELGLELAVQVEGAVEEAGAGDAGSVLARRAAGRPR